MTFDRARLRAGLGSSAALGVGWLGLVAVVVLPTALRAACGGCTAFGPGQAWGQVQIKELTEASGLVISRVNPGVFWTHNDGSRNKLYAFTFDGSLLATYDLGKSVDDFEDVAIGPGPANSTYLYAGDIGGSAGADGTRSTIKILRTLEPTVPRAWLANPHSPNFSQVDKFEFEYPDGSYDAESLMVDPLSGDAFIITKQKNEARLYRADLNHAVSGQLGLLEFIRALPFSLASASSISADGEQILLRRENVAVIWNRCPDESVGDALARPGQAVPVIGPPTEPNGEGIDFVGAQGYATISEGLNPVLYFFPTQCPAAPVFTQLPQNQTNEVGQAVRFTSAALGNPAPQFIWTHDGQIVSGATGASLVLSNLTLADAGAYQLTLSNASGTVSATAQLTVLSRPDLRITEVQSNESPNPPVATSDWWELTSFESQPVDLYGYRFNDDTGDLSDPFVLKSHVIVQPGESIVWVEDLTPAQFIAWWGATNLPPNLQIVSYQGNGLKLSADGDSVQLWDSTTRDPTNTVARVSFGPAASGVSFGFDPATGTFGQPSALGVNGVVRAAASADIGSPGRIRAPAPNPQLSATRTTDSLRIQFLAAAGQHYVLLVAEDPTGDSWSPTGDEWTVPSDTVVSVQIPLSSHARYFRVSGP